jgi:GT2 family glycosyltransferase
VPLPDVSIVTPLFNKGPWIGATIASVLAQSEASFEMLVVDNGSTDDGAAVVGGARDPRIRLLQYTERQGPGSARNFGVAKARGQWVLFLDADDLLDPDHLARLLARAKESDAPDVVVTGWREFVDGDASGTARAKEPYGLGKSLEALRSYSVAFAPWAINCALLHRRVFDRGVRWQEEFDRMPSEDVAFWFDALKASTCAFVPGHSAVYRTQTTNSRNVVGTRRGIEGWSAILARNVGLAGAASSRDPELQRLLAAAYARLAADAATAGMPAESRDYWRAADDALRRLWRDTRGARLADGVKFWLGARRAAAVGRLVGRLRSTAPQSRNGA